MCLIKHEGINQVIELNLDLAYLSYYYELSTKRINQYAARDPESIITLETMAGAVTLDKEEFMKLMNKPSKVAKILQLQSPKNRYLILKNLNERDLAKILPYLSSEQLAWGLQYFTSKKLEDLINKLPTEQVATLVFQHFGIMDILDLMEDDKMNQFLKSDKLEKKDVMKYFEQLDDDKFRNIMMKQFGISMQKKDRGDYLTMIDEMNPDKFLEFLMNFDRKDKMELIAGLVEINPEYILEFENEDISRPFMLMDKDKILKTMPILDPEFLTPMIEELPPELIQVVATQIDPEVFAQILVEEFPDVLMEMLLG